MARWHDGTMARFSRSTSSADSKTASVPEISLGSSALDPRKHAEPARCFAALQRAQLAKPHTLYGIADPEAARAQRGLVARMSGQNGD